MRDRNGRFSKKAPLRILSATEQVIAEVVNTPRFVEWGPCGSPPQMHRWTEWQVERIGIFALRSRSCKDCGFWTGVME